MESKISMSGNDDHEQILSLDTSDDILPTDAEAMNQMIRSVNTFFFTSSYIPVEIPGVLIFNAKLEN